ncbi:8f4586e2-0664-49bf-884a-de2f2ffa8fd7 [Thermothielavioides terrestris]|uniref:8f4586e2-0664-49bf-884a-de2f2ffa8fd7 n=1 Tax=Thermothielavioides terrestris TaxID=2587410 RepID=A0A446B8M7_9PEZI|nr:8f4586e2-0664-49bf-884a-de2f2ffa8fd7 [Thermothielavioides terrestris]
MSSAAGHSTGVSRPLSRLERRLDSSRPSSRPPSSSSSTSQPTRPSSAAGIVTPAHNADPIPARPNSRQSLHGVSTSSASPSSGKRKRDVPAVASDGLLRAPVVLKPHPSSLTTKPRMLHPLMLLPRERLPLSALDLSHPQGDFPSSRLFESKIKILDLEGRLGSNLLLARSETSRMVYAVERESNGLYVLCKLGSWVDIEKLSRTATVVCRERLRSACPAKPESENAAAPPLTTPSLYKANKRRRLAIDEIQSLVRKRTMSVTEKEPQNQAPIATEETPASRRDESRPTTPADAHDPAPSDDLLSQPNADEIFQNIRAQYMEALYHSKGSLAYFAKGPLSRARAAFHLDWDSNLDMNDLVDFLKSLVVTTVVIDKKYRETIPEIVAKMKALVPESDHGASKPRKRKAKKPKLGKDGLYPGEVDHIRRWWSSHQPVSGGDDEKTLKILALEPVALAKGRECQLPGMEAPVDPRDTSQELSAKKRNKHNLPLLLDVHADRLCIWHSTTLDEIKAVAESQMPAEGQEGQNPDRANSDPLRDFCVDIIVPFFSARLPGPCDALNRKLGGPTAQSPPKEKAAKPASAVRSKPGAPMKKVTASSRDKQRTLERALSAERSRRSVSQGPAATIALLRSASQTVIPGLKREASESSLIGLIPKAESNSLKESRPSIFSRSVSLSGMDLKAQKKARVEAELKDAISALKKPNRTLAVKDFVEAAETRRASVGQLKKLKKPSRASLVQVKATPANNRYKDVLAAETSKSQPLPSLDIPPSSASVVPASTQPRKFAHRLSHHTQPAECVNATPVRPTSSIPTSGLRQQVQETPGARILPSSPVMARKAAPPPPPPAPAFFAPPAAQPRGAQHLSVPGAAAANANAPSSPGLDALFETPVAPRSAKESRLDMVDDTPIRPRLPLAVAGDGGIDGDENGTGGGGGDGMTIYQRLGWDTTDLDDIDDLL